MVNITSALTLGLMVSTASAALKNDKRHVHHRRAKAPCTTSTIASVPYPVGNSTQPAGTGAVSTKSHAVTSSSEPVVTYTVVPVPINTSGGVDTTTKAAPPHTSAAAGTPPQHTSAGAGVPSPSGDAGKPTPPAGNGGSVCGVATSYVTVQQTVTVTAGQEPKSTPPVVVVPAPVPTPSTSSVKAVETTAVETTAVPPPGAFAQTGGSGGAPSPAPVVEQPHTSVVESTPAASPPAKSSPPKSSGGSTSCSAGKKAGVAWSSMDGSFASLGNINGACWAYDWNFNSAVSEGVEYVPSLQKPEFKDQFASSVKSQSGVTFIKHVNEPDMPRDRGGCLSTPHDMANLHKDVMAPLQGQYQIGMPAISAYDTTNSMYTQTLSGLKWLEAFVAEAGCNFAFADAHWYGEAGVPVNLQVKYFTEYVETLKTRLDAMCPGSNLPIWFTELGTGNPADIDSFMATVAPILDKDARVARYSAWNGQNSAISGVLSSILSAL